MSFEPDLSRIILRNMEIFKPRDNPRLVVSVIEAYPSAEEMFRAGGKHQEIQVNYIVWGARSNPNSPEESENHFQSSIIDLKKCLSTFFNVKGESTALEFAQIFGPLGISDGVKTGLRDPITEQRLTDAKVCEQIDEIVSLAERLRCFKKIGRSFDPFRPRKSHHTPGTYLTLKDLDPPGTFYSFDQDEYIDPDSAFGDRKRLGSIDEVRYELVSDAIRTELTQLLRIRIDLYKSPIVEPVSLYGALLLYLYQTSFLNQESAGRYKRCTVCDTSIWETSKAAGRKQFCSDACRKLAKPTSGPGKPRTAEDIRRARARWRELHDKQAPLAAEVHDLIDVQLRTFGAEVTLNKLKRLFAV